MTGHQSGSQSAQLIANGGASSVAGLYEYPGATSGRPVAIENDSQIIFSSGQKDYALVLNACSGNAIAAWDWKDVLIPRWRADNQVSAYSRSMRARRGVFLVNWLPSGSAPQVTICEVHPQEGINPEEMEADRLAAIAEYIEALPLHDVLLQWARENPPPEDWFDEDYDLR